MVKPHFPQISFPVQPQVTWIIFIPFQGAQNFFVWNSLFSFFSFSALLLPALGPHTLFSTFPRLPAAAKLWPLLVQPCSHSPPQMDSSRISTPEIFAAHLCSSKLLVSVQPEQWGYGTASRGSSCSPSALVCCPGSQPTGLSWWEISQKSEKKEMCLRYVLLWGLNVPLNTAAQLIPRGTEVIQGKEQ